MELRILAQCAFIACLLPAWAQAQTGSASDQSATSNRTSASAFNPAIGVIFNGVYGRLSQAPGTYVLPGFALAPETAPGERGFSLGESEVNFNANVDNQYFGNLTVALTPEGAAEVEEAYIRTIGLPQGFTLKAGRFLSAIGYMNEQHAHAWDFTDAPLPYRAMLADQLKDDGIQIRWLAPIEAFLTELGVEALRGDHFPAGGTGNNGNDAHTVFVHVGGDVGASHSWRAGLSHVNTHAAGRQTADATDPDLFTGTSKLDIVDFIWKWAPNGNPTVTNFKFQAEYFQGAETGRFTPNAASAIAAADIDRDRSGWYAQAVYQFMPRFRTGLRYDAVKADTVPGLEGSVLDPAGHTPKRGSIMLDFSNSEFSRVRLQYNRDQSRVDRTDNQVFLQYIMSIGAHGAHKF